jgi:hypothetical protein
MSERPTRELTPDEIVADIEAMKPRKRKVTIYQSWPRMILERERKRASPDSEALRGAALVLLDDMIAAAKIGARQYIENSRELAYRHGRSQEIASLQRLRATLTGGQG